MKKILLILLLSTLGAFAQSSTMLLLFSDEDVWNITITSSANPTITMQGTGQIIIDWDDGSALEFYNLTGSDQNISHTYSGTATRVIKIYNKNRITKFATSSNVNWNFDLRSLPRKLTYFYCAGSNTVTGDLSSLPAGLTIFSCWGSNTVTGDLSSLPAGLTYFYCAGSNTVTGDLSSLPAGLTIFSCGGSNTVTGDLSSLPAGLTYFNCWGSNTITGNLNSLPSGLIYFRCLGLNTIADYTSGRTWANNMQRVELYPTAGYGLTSAEVDSLLIDLATVPTWVGEKTIDLRGNNAPRTTASDSAVATLVSKGVTVLTN